MHLNRVFPVSAIFGSPSSADISSLPDVPLLAIIQRLPWRDRIRVEGVCKRWRHLSYTQGWAHVRHFSYTDYTPDMFNKFLTKEYLYEENIGDVLDRCGVFA